MLNVKFQGTKTTDRSLAESFMFYEGEMGPKRIMEIFQGFAEQVSDYRFTKMSLASSQVNKLLKINESLNCRFTFYRTAISGGLCNIYLAAVWRCKSRHAQTRSC